MPDHAWAKFQPSGGLGGGLSVTKRGQRRGRSSGRPRAIEIRDPFGRKEGENGYARDAHPFFPNSSKNDGRQTALLRSTYLSANHFLPRLSSNFPFPTSTKILPADKKETLRWKDYARYAACSNLNWEEGEAAPSFLLFTDFSPPSFPFSRS